MAILHGNEVANNKRYSQVYQATHVGEISLPYMRRSFISFTYGGKKIEDFDLIATVSGDRLNKPGYASFEDTVTTYDNLDGQQYWATHYKTNQLDFTLSTDGIDQKKLDDFLHWFKAGVYRELILAEHPNRAIMARVAQPPTINMLPFEHDTQIVLSNDTYNVKTTLYKGDISLSLVMDQPHWYALTNILGKKVAGVDGNTDRFIDRWDDPFTGEQNISIFSSQDALKILYEDGIPLGSMIEANMLLGNGAYANTGDNIYSKIWNPNYEPQIPNIDNLEGGGACIQGTVEGVLYQGVIHGAIVNATGNGISTLESGQSAYFFYSGTAPAPTIISFTLTPSMNNGYISSPKNNYTNGTYNEIIIESVHKQSLKFTTPNIYTSYNKCIKIFDSISSSYTWEDIQENLRDKVHHAKVRAWAMQCVATEIKKNSALDSNAKARVKLNMSYFFKTQDEEPELLPATFTFNSETGTAIGNFSYRTFSSGANANTVWKDFGTVLSNQEEDVGDMLRSNYIIIQDRNYADDHGKIVAWSSSSDVSKSYSHRIKHDVEGGLTNLQLLYKNMYL